MPTPHPSCSEWHGGAAEKSARSGAQSARDAFEAVLPALLKALAQAPDSDRAIARFDNMIEAMPSAINVFRLLEARPGLLQLVADILSYAHQPWPTIWRRQQPLSRCAH